MNYHAILTGFGNYTKEQAEELKKACRLSMSAETLAFCISHYKNQEQRDPSLDELYMLDQLSAIQENTLGAPAPTDLYTNDEFCAESYADLIKKRKELNPHATYPMTSIEATRIANAYLLQNGTKSNKHNVSFFPEYIEAIDVSPDMACVVTPDSVFRLRILSPSDAELAESDRLLLVCPSVNQSRFQFIRVLEAALASSSLRSYLKSVTTVRDSGILYELLETISSVCIDLTAFSAWHAPMPMTVLTNQYGACRILRITADGLSSVTNALHTHGLHVISFGTINNDGKYTFMRGTSDRAQTLDPQFMRLLFRYHATKICLNDEYVLPPCHITHRIINDHRCRYPQSDSFLDTIVINGTTTAAASASPTSSFFKTALYTTLLPIVTLAARGADPTRQILSIGMEFAENYTDPSAVGETFSTILGVYRAQTELELPANGLSVRTSPTAIHPRITVFSVADGDFPCKGFQQSGHYVYCLAPSYRPNGLPDFRSLRTMLNRLNALNQAGAILSAYVLGCESITDGLLHMSTAYTCRLTDLRVASDGMLPLGVLIESDRPLSEREIGITETVR